VKAFPQGDEHGAPRWRAEPSIAGFIGRMNVLFFETIAYRLRIRGATTIGRCIIGERPVVFRRTGGAAFSFPAADSYYGHYLYRGMEYEPEIAFLIERSGMDNLIDCGANFGYWPCFATGLTGMIVAVELSAKNYEWLVRNAALNDGRFATLNAAVWSDDETLVEVAEGVRSHAGQSGRPASAGIRSRSVDSIMTEFKLDPARTIVKVDCEGAEPQVLAGAARTAEGGGLFVVEEHGKDPSCALAKSLEKDGWILYRWEERWIPATVQDIATRKTDPRKGYNVLAHRPGVSLAPALVHGPGPVGRP